MEATASAQVTITKPTINRVISESPDFPSEQFADPWDMSQRTDLSYGEYMNDLGDIRWRRGIFSARSTGGDAAVNPLFPGYEGVVHHGRDGFINRISTKRYRRFSIRIYSSRRTTAQLFWFYNQRWTDFGVVGFKLEPGWHTYIVNPVASGKWRGRPIGLRLDPTHKSNVLIKIDWMRLYKRTKRRVVLEWTDTAPRGQTLVYLDVDKDPSNKNMDLLAEFDSRSRNSFYWDPSPYVPRSYFLYVKPAGQPGVYSKRIKINRAPLTTILDPDEKGGKDYARSVTGDAWDMSQPGDIWYWQNLKDVQFARGKMSGIPTTGDGYFHLRVPTPIDTDKYHRLVFRFRYEGPFNYGDGTMCRVIWTPDHHKIYLFQTSNDIVTEPAWKTYVIDLKKVKLDGGAIGWNGPVTDVRFDPLEWRARRRFFVDYIRINADDRAKSRFTIKWRDKKRKRRRTLVNLFYDGNQTGFNGRLIAKNLVQRRGVNKFVWKTRRIPAGTYYVYAVAKDGISTSKAYSSGPLKIIH